MIKEAIVVFVVVALISLCDGRVATVPDVAKGPVIDRLPASGPHEHSVTATSHAGSATATTSHGGSATATSSAQDGIATATSNDGTSSAGGVPTPEMNICYPYDCPVFKPIVEPNSKIHKKEFPEGKWLKIKKKPFKPNNSYYYKEVNEYVTEAGIPGAVPAVVKVDCPPDHKQRYQHYVERHQSIVNELYQLNNRTNALLVALGNNVSYAERVLSLTKDLQTEFDQYVRGFNMTVLNYLHPQYQASPYTPGAPALQPPTPTNANLTIIKEPSFVVMPGVYNRVPGLEYSHEMALTFSQTIDVPFTTYYMASYFNMNFEIWLTPDPKTKLFE